MPTTSNATKRPTELTLYHSKRPIASGAYIGSSSQFLVNAGSRMRAAETQSIPAGVKARRQELLDHGALEHRGEYFILKNDEIFTSISNAAGVLLGRSANGKLEWKPGSHTSAQGSGHSESNARASANNIIHDAAPSVETAAKGLHEGQNPISRGNSKTSRTPDKATNIVTKTPTKATPTNNGTAIESTADAVIVELSQRRTVVAHGIVQPTGPGPISWSAADHTGPITVLEGSTFRTKESKSLSAPYKRLRDELFDDPDLFEPLHARVAAPERRTLKQNYEFTALSAAASAITGSQVNGRNAWNPSAKLNPEDDPAGSTHETAQRLFSGLALHLGFTDGAEIEAGILESMNTQTQATESTVAMQWRAGPLPVPYTGDSQVANKSSAYGGTVDRQSAFPTAASTLLGLTHENTETSSQANSDSRWHLDLRDNPQQFEGARDGDLASVVAIEILLDINAQKRRQENTDRPNQLQPLVLVLHLQSDDEISNGQLAQQLGLWLYGGESVEFRSYLSTLIGSLIGGAKLPEGEMHSYVTLHGSFNEAQASGRITHEELLKLASLRAPGQKRTAVQSGGTPIATKPPSDRLVEWDENRGAVFKRSAMFVYDTILEHESDEDPTTAMETSSVYSDVVALTMLENLTLNSFIQRSQHASDALVEIADDIDDHSIDQAKLAKTLELSAELVEDLQRDFMANSSRYGKLHIIMRSNGGDIYRALRARWRLQSLRNDIAEEIERLRTHAATIAVRIRDEVEKEKSEEQRAQESTISLLLAFAGIVIGAPAISDFVLAQFGLNPLITFGATCIAAIALPFAVPPFIRQVQAKQKSLEASNLPRKELGTAASGNLD